MHIQYFNNQPNCFIPKPKKLHHIHLPDRKHPKPKTRPKTPPTATVAKAHRPAGPSTPNRPPKEASTPNKPSKSRYTTADDQTSVPRVLPPQTGPKRPRMAMQLPRGGRNVARNFTATTLERIINLEWSRWGVSDEVRRGSRRVVRPLWRCSFGFSGWMQNADVLLGGVVRGVWAGRSIGTMCLFVGFCVGKNKG